MALPRNGAAMACRTGISCIRLPDTAARSTSSAFSVSRPGPGVQVKIDYRPVHMQPLDNEMEHIPPKPRVY